MRFGAVSSQLLALGSQLSYTPYRKEDAQTLFAHPAKAGGETPVPSAEGDFLQYQRQKGGRLFYGMNEKLKEKIKESLSSVLPITVIVLLLSITLVPLEVGTLTLFLTGAVLLIVGIGLFQLGAEMAMTPLGQGVGSKLSKGKRIFPIILICFVIGAIITIAEPDLQVLANQVASIPNQVLIWTVAIGVGVFLAVAVLRIRFHISLRRLLAVCYILLFVLSFFSPSSFTSVAF